MAVYILTAAQLRGAGILNSFIIPSSSTPPTPTPTPTVDPDAQAFITAAAITDPTQQTAINTLVVSMKGYGVWTKMKALYPMVGGTASQHKFNLKNPLDTDAAFRLVFNGGWTHSSTGALPNGTNAYANTFLIPSSILSLNSTHLSVYSRTNIVSNSVEIGSSGSGGGSPYLLMQTRISGDLIAAALNDNGAGIKASNVNSFGFHLGNRTGASVKNTFKNGVKILSDTHPSTSLNSNNIFISSYNTGNLIPDLYSSRETAFSSIGDGLTDTEAANYYTAVQTFQTTLGRHVGVPIVSDSDAQAFLNAAVITDSTQASAVNTLVTDLKGYGVWTKMKALYPFVGGTATTHKFNSKNPLDTDAAFRLVFSGGWTHSSTGALPNGTNAWANTFLNHSATLPLNSFNYGYYSRSTSTAFSELMGAYELNLRNTQLFLNDIPSNITGDAFSISSRVTSAVPSFNGLLNYGRLNANSLSVYRNSNVLTTDTTNVTGLAPVPNVYIGALNYFGNASFFTSLPCALSYISDGLTNTEVTNLYTAVENFQVTLGRNVNVPVVSDADAQAFLNAAVITDSTQATAVNTLVTSLKGYGIWTKMKALYPMVGGTAATHKWNLKNPLDTDAAFRLVFNGGWTHSSTGALPNGTNAYANTFFNPTTQALSKDSTHISYYRRNTNNVQNAAVLMAAIVSVPSIIRLSLIPNFNATLNITEIVSTNFQQSGTGINDLGLINGNRNSSTEFKVFANNTLKQTVSRNSISQPNLNLFLACSNGDNSPQYYTNNECALSSIGSGLTDTEAANYYTAVQAFQTTLGRQV